MTAETRPVAGEEDDFPESSAAYGVVDATTRMAARALTSEALTSEALTRDCLARIEEREATVRAWAWIDDDRAIERAQRCDRERVELANKPLLGLPVGIKDVISTADIPTGMGSPIYADFVPARSAIAVTALEHAGAFVLGKTVTTEFATQHPGDTRNPWNPEHTPGGSSSGSAAAVAAGFVPAALGTQTRGSIIRPAAYCGVVGYKPSFGSISTDGIFTLSQTLDHVGVIARSVLDTAVVAACLMAPNSAEAQKAISNLARPERALRLVAVKTPVWHLATQPQVRNFAESIERLKGAGAEVQEIELPATFNAAMDAVRAIQLREIAERYAPKLAGWGSLVSTAFRKYVEDGTQVGATEYEAALATRDTLIADLTAFFAGCDAIITPPATGEAPRGLTFTGDASFCAIWTLCGAPAITVPSGRGPQGLPLGLQIVGPPGADQLTLRAAHWCEEQLRPNRRPVAL